jgi:hypothetical protein
MVVFKVTAFNCLYKITSTVLSYFFSLLKKNSGVDMILYSGVDMILDKNRHTYTRDLRCSIATMEYRLSTKSKVEVGCIRTLVIWRTCLIRARPYRRSGLLPGSNSRIIHMCSHSARSGPDSPPKSRGLPPEHAK